MEIINGLENVLKGFKNITLTIGNFDGVHIGHQHIFQDVKHSAHASSSKSMVVTFDPHPMKITHPEREIPLLTSFEEKVRLIEATGVDFLLCIKFTQNFANTDPHDFVRKVLINKLSARHIIVGRNFRFGKEKQGTPELLATLGTKYGYAFDVVESVMQGAEVISSSSIRRLIAEGNVKQAATFLGRPYAISGHVIKGMNRGKRLMNIPTANLSQPFELTPKEGVYAVMVRLDKQILPAVANIGLNPTFGSNSISYEVHILNYNDELLGKPLTVYFIERLRDEQTFKNINALKEQILKDISNATSIFLAEHNRVYVNI
ncbi:MAG: bifunctional riboflavin kinase/FAD synthetase [Candidatus Magnetoovum sp. WYHC-5]|nr:bifunctional riboflavin kinase/FAD synthetase [Candidatus Magnetoovum sp. WYHC-5]